VIRGRILAIGTALAMAAIALPLAACSPSSSSSSSTASATATASSTAITPAPSSAPALPQGNEKTVTAQNAPEYVNTAGGFNGVTLHVGMKVHVFCHSGKLYLVSSKYPIYVSVQDIDNGRPDNQLGDCATEGLPLGSNP
jgi:hypothetical protein